MDRCRDAFSRTQAFDHGHGNDHMGKTLARDEPGTARHLRREAPVMECRLWNAVYGMLTSVTSFGSGDKIVTRS